MRTMISRVVSALLLLALWIGAAPAGAKATSTVEFERFGKVEIYRPSGPAKSVVLFVSGDGGWNLGVVGMAEALAGDGAIVVGIDIRNYLAALAGARTSCVSLAEDFEALSHFVQRDLGLPQYLLPTLVGYSSGATVVYATLAQSPAGTFTGAISMGFCPDQDMSGATLCKESVLDYTHSSEGALLFGPAPRLEDPWIVLQGQQDQVCSAGQADEFGQAMKDAEVVRLPKVGHGFSVERNWLPQLHAAFQKLAQRSSPPPRIGQDLGDLPLTEVLPKAGAATGDAATPLLVLLTGDGGWAGIDKQVSAALAAKGIPVVGFNSLRYYWKARSADEAAAAVARTIEHYSLSLSRPRVILVGYSFGADVLPFIVNRLPANLRGLVDRIVLIGPSQSAVFEVKISGWIPGLAAEGEPLAPELAKLDAGKVLCLYGAEEPKSSCPALALAGARTEQIGVGHHMSGQYDAVVRHILEFVR